MKKLIQKQMLSLVRFFASLFVAVSVVVSVAPTITLAFDKDDSETVVRQMMCATPKHYYSTKSGIKKELNGVLQDALRFEGVKSISELADRAGNRSGLRYATRSILSEAVFLAAITENRAALVDLTRLEMNLCKSKPKDGGMFSAKGCERLTKALRDPETFIKNAKDQYAFIQDERFRTPKVKGESKPVEKNSASDLLSASQTGAMMETYKKSNRYVMDSGAFPEIDSFGQLPEKIDNAPNPGQRCAEKSVGALKTTFENYTPGGNVVVLKDSEKGSRENTLSEGGFSEKLRAPGAGQR